MPTLAVTAMAPTRLPPPPAAAAASVRAARSSTRALTASRSSATFASSSLRCISLRRAPLRPATSAQAVAGAAVDASSTNDSTSNTWPDGTFRGSWKSMECPPNPRLTKGSLTAYGVGVLLRRPDIYAAPTYIGDVSTSPGARVQVRVYMIDRFGLSRVGRMVLRKEFDAIWHVGVVVHGREYNFADKVAYMNIGGEDIESQSMHGFAPSYVYEVGNTTKTREELDEFVFGTLSKRFCIENYCSFTNNCHNFSDEVTRFLVGKGPAEGGFPQWCLDHGGAALSNLPNADAETIRLASNKIAKVMMVSFGKFNRERMKILEGKEWENPLEEGKDDGDKAATQPNASN